jgi:hypothetical protein
MRGWASCVISVLAVAAGVYLVTNLVGRVVRDIEDRSPMIELNDRHQCRWQGYSAGRDVLSAYVDLVVYEDGNRIRLQETVVARLPRAEVIEFTRHEMALWCVAALGEHELYKRAKELQRRRFIGGDMAAPPPIEDDFGGASKCVDIDLDTRICNWNLRPLEGA